MEIQQVGWGAWTGLIWLRIRKVGGLFCSIELPGSTNAGISGLTENRLASQEGLCFTERVSK
jgi:hypothetical protein